MEISTTYPNQPAPIKPNSSSGKKVSTLDAVAGAEAIKSIPGNTDKTDNAYQDTVNLSPEALKLAQTPAPQTTPAIAIDSQAQAKKAVEKLAADIQNYPQTAQDAYRKLPANNLKALMA